MLAEYGWLYLTVWLDSLYNTSELYMEKRKNTEQFNTLNIKFVTRVSEKIYPSFDVSTKF